MTSPENKRNFWQYDEVEMLLNIIYEKNILKLVREKSLRTDEAAKLIESCMFKSMCNTKNYKQIWAKWKTLKSDFLRLRSGKEGTATSKWYEHFDILAKILETPAGDSVTPGSARKPTIIPKIKRERPLKREIIAKIELPPQPDDEDDEDDDDENIPILYKYNLKNDQEDDEDEDKMEELVEVEETEEVDENEEESESVSMTCNVNNNKNQSICKSTQSNTSMDCSIDVDDPDLSFLKSLLPDIKGMKPIRKNEFKIKVLTAINESVLKSKQDQN